MIYMCISSHIPPSDLFLTDVFPRVPTVTCTLIYSCREHFLSGRVFVAVCFSKQEKERETRQGNPAKVEDSDTKNDDIYHEDMRACCCQTTLSWREIGLADRLKLDLKKTS